jgi:SAM-dependent methyltransferase
MQSELLKKADELERRSIFLGGPKSRFIAAGRCQLEILLAHGLVPEDSVLDVGCGALRGGWWTINFLRPGRYFGIEPNVEMLNAGKEVMLGAELLAEKRPTFSHNDNFDFSVFGEKFDFVIARSVWTHTSKAQISAMLDSFIQNAKPGACILASIVRPKGKRKNEYAGDGWIGRSHTSDDSGIAHYTFDSIEQLCRNAGLEATKLEVMHGQLWIKVTHPVERLSSFLRS